MYLAQYPHLPLCILFYKQFIIPWCIPSLPGLVRREGVSLDKVVPSSGGELIYFPPTNPPPFFSESSFLSYITVYIYTRVVLNYLLNTRGVQSYLLNC